MDNFLDTLAQKYNAQEMIRANSQAEAAEMQRLQEQVEAYEAVLQEMRKLNYKNTELTEKMYSLVDESIEKVRTLQIEASENGANTEMIAQQMSEAVSTAMAEAVKNIDLQGTQSLTETVRNAADEIMLAADDVRQSNKSLDETIRSQAETDKIFDDLLKNQLSQVMENSRQVISAMEEMKVAIETQMELSQQTPPADEYLEQEQGKELAALLEASESLKSSIEALQYSDEATKAYLSGMQETNTVVTSQLQGISETGTAVAAQLQDLSAANTAANAQLQGISETNAALAEQIKTVTDASSLLAEQVGKITETLSTALSELEQVRQSQAELKADQGRMAEAQTGLGSAQQEMAELQKNCLETLAQKPSSDQGEEAKTFYNEQTAANEELRSGIRSVKLATDETKNTLKSSFDSAIYGLKQDNKEIVEFLQRMNSGLIAKLEDAEKEEDGQEETDPQEETRKALEELFKSNEDFMHKESVKVYRNVQAVLNEKTERQTDGLESQIHQVTTQVGQVKTVAVIGLILAAAGVAIQVLQIFGLI